MRLTEKVKDKYCAYDIKKGCLCKSFEKLGQLEDIMEKHNIATVQDLETVLNIYKGMIHDLDQGRIIMIHKPDNKIYSAVLNVNKDMFKHSKKVRIKKVKWKK